MEGTALWDIIKTIISCAWIPLGMYMSYKNNRDNKVSQWKEEIEKRIVSSEGNSKLQEVQIQTIRETLRDTKDSIREVKQGVDKLIDRLLK